MSFLTGFAEMMLRAADRNTGGLSDQVCKVRWAKRTEGYDDVAREVFFTYGEPAECGTRLLIAKAGNVLLQCGACGIRWADCVHEAKKLYGWREKGLDSRRPDWYAVKASDLRMFRMACGFDGDKDSQKIWAEAQAAYKVEADHYERERRNDKAMMESQIRKGIEKKVAYKKIAESMGYKPEKGTNEKW